MKEIKVYLPEDMLAAVDDCAADQTRDRSNLIRHALKGYLSRYGYKPPETVENPLHVHARGSEGKNQ
jgi:metal-responsive CopG/Arc/MetJ family transcriptional regulator